MRRLPSTLTSWSCGAGTVPPLPRTTATATAMAARPSSRSKSERTARDSHLLPHCLVFRDALPGSSSGRPGAWFCQGTRARLPAPAGRVPQLRGRTDDAGPAPGRPPQALRHASVPAQRLRVQIGAGPLRHPLPKPPARAPFPFASVGAHQRRACRGRRGTWGRCTFRGTTAAVEAHAPTCLAAAHASVTAADAKDSAEVAALKVSGHACFATQTQTQRLM